MPDIKDEVVIANETSEEVAKEKKKRSYLPRIKKSKEQATEEKNLMSNIDNEADKQTEKATANVAENKGTIGFASSSKELGIQNLKLNDKSSFGTETDGERVRIGFAPNGIEDLQQKTQDVARAETQGATQGTVQFTENGATETDNGSGFQKNDRQDRQNFWQKRRDNRQEQQEEYVINTEKVMNVQELREKDLDELLKIAEQYEVQNLNRMLKQDIISAILKQSAIKGEGLYTDGCLEIMDEGGFGFLRDSKNNYKPSSYDAYISQGQIRRLGLRQGDVIGAYIKEPRRQEKYFSVARLETINGKKIDDIKNKINFDNLTPLYPTEKLRFDKLNNPKEAVSTRVIDLICPIGKGQRALIVAPPRAGKTFLMQAIAHAINENHPEAELIVLLIDERPEEVTDMVRSVKGEVVSSTFDEPAKRHVELAEIVIEKARRMVEDGKDVIILLDSITRLARAYNAIAPSSGKVLTGGVDSNALQKPKRFFGTARNIENGGSLTIIATALVETGSKMDEVIFEEFKGTGNAEIVLDRKIAEKRLFPAVDILKSGTRKEEEMVEKDTLQKMWILRRILIQMAGNGANNTADALDFLLEKLKKTKDNAEFFDTMNSGVGKMS